MIGNFFSTSLYNVCKQYCLSQNINIDELGYEDIVATTKDLIFDFDYNLYGKIDVENHKNNIETLFVSKYLFDDLGVYSFGEWRLHFRIAFNQAIEKYNIMWKNEDIFSDYLISNKIENISESKTNEYGKQIAEEKTNKTETEQEVKRSFDNSNGGDITKSKQVYYDMPMDEINQPAYTSSGATFTLNGETATRQYATNMTKDENEVIRNSIEKNNATAVTDENGNKTQKQSGEDNESRTLKRNALETDTPFFEVLQKMRDCFLSVDLMFINDNIFKDLFSPILM